MIRLTDILTEITLASVSPYATQFVWHRPHHADDTWECTFEADSRPIKMVMQRWKTPIPHFDYEYQFSFFTRGQYDRFWIILAGNLVVRGALNVLALLKTLALAIRDFADQTPDCDAIDITGADSADAKGEQKSRIYVELFQANAMNMGFALKQFGGKLYLIRNTINGRTADATSVA